MKACQGAAVAAVAAAALLAGGDARSVNDASISKTISLPLFHERGTPLPSTRRLADSVQQVNRRALNDGNGTSIAAGGDIWPVGVYWTTIEVGTPPKEVRDHVASTPGEDPTLTAPYSSPLLSTLVLAFSISKGLRARAATRRHPTGSTTPRPAAPASARSLSSFPTRTRLATCPTSPHRARFPGRSIRTRFLSLGWAPST